VEFSLRHGTCPFHWQLAVKSRLWRVCPVLVQSVEFMACGWQTDIAPGDAVCPKPQEIAARAHAHMEGRVYVFWGETTPPPIQ
jgi:hypothetical protein